MYALYTSVVVDGDDLFRYEDQRRFSRAAAHDDDDVECHILCALCFI